MSQLVYFSSVSDNTRRFVEKLGMDAIAVALRGAQPEVNEPYILITPTYGGGDLPKQVERFLATAENSQHIVGVIGAGNTNFGEDYCKAGRVIADRYDVPLLYKFELMGTPVDVENVRRGVGLFFESLECV